MDGFQKSLIVVSIIALVCAVASAWLLICIFLAIAHSILTM